MKNRFIEDERFSICNVCSRNDETCDFCNSCVPKFRYIPSNFEMKLLPSKADKK